MDSIDSRKFEVSWSTFCVLVGHDFCPLERAIPSTCTFIFSLLITPYIYLGLGLYVLYVQYFVQVDSEFAPYLHTHNIMAWYCCLSS